LLDEPVAAKNDTVYSVSQVNAVIKGYLEASPVLADLTVSGEVSNYRKPSSGHHYFTLRDSESALSCVMFRYGRGGEFISDGAQVIAHGRVSVYTARGDLQLYVDTVRPDGIGALQQAFEALKLKLEKEGLFDEGRKRQLPEFPGTIAVITSPSGAVIQDIINVLSRRYPLADVLLIPTSVQGESAAPEIVQAFSVLKALDHVDLAIVARGGGSLEDLWPFNEEIVARAIFSCGVPVISAVGHETDFTIADFVADVRAPTPSAAAEIATPDLYDLQRDVAGYAEYLRQAAERDTRDRRRQLDLLMDRMEYRIPDTVTPRQRVEELLARGRRAVSQVTGLRRADLRGIEAQLSALGPGKILHRGYAIVRVKDGPVAVSVDDISVDDELEVTLQGGSADARVTAVNRDTD
jgi:exodeoxyribonuclease VII large subunit